MGCEPTFAGIAVGFVAWVRGATPFRPALNAQGNLSTFGFVATLPRSATMKRILVALVLAVGVFGVVGCGGGSSSGKTTTSTNK